MATELQKLAREVNWFTGCTVRPIGYGQIPEGLSRYGELIHLVNRHNMLVQDIKDLSKRLYEAERDKLGPEKV